MTRMNVSRQTVGRRKRKAPAEDVMLYGQQKKTGPINPLTLNEYFEEWILQKETTLEKEVTPYRYRINYRNNIKTILGDKPIREISRRDILHLQSELSKHLRPVSVNYVVQLIHQILNDAVADELIPKNPCRQVKRLKTAGAAASCTIHRALTPEEQRLFMQAAKHSWYYEYIAFLLLTGARQGEGAAITWGDIDHRNGVLHIRKSLTLDRNGHVVVGTPKSEAGIRDIPMNETIRRVLEGQKTKVIDRFGEEKAGITDRIFISSRGGLLHNATINQVLRRIQEQMDAKGLHIDHFSCHALRDTFATRFIEQGGTPQTLKTLLGHATLSMTMDLYAHVLPDTKKKEMDQVVIEIE